MNLPANRKYLPAPFFRVALSPLALLIGCASPGPPRPPSLHLPQIVPDLTAERMGSQVALHWTTPAKTTDDLKVQPGMTAEICRGAVAGVNCSVIRRIAVAPGSSEGIDVLPPNLIVDPQVLLEYRVSILNAGGHSAGYSQPAFVAAGSAPPMVEGLRAATRGQGVVLQWQPRDAADVIELTRTHILPLAKHTKVDPVAKQPFHATQEEPAELKLLAEKVSPERSPFRQDAGGTLDASARRGETYAYTAERIRSVVLDHHTLQIRSAQSASITVVMNDHFPPHPPTGLVSIPGGEGAGLSVDLSWTPNVEEDLAGYLVYRQEVGINNSIVGPARLTPSPIAEPSFHDASVLAGHSYSYRVTAVDVAGNESRPGESVREELRQP